MIPLANQKNQERGSALLVSIFITGALMSVVGLYSRSQQMTRKIVKKNQMQIARDQIAKDILSTALNPEVLKKISRKEYLGLAKGNQLLHDCIRSDYSEHTPDLCVHSEMDAKPGPTGTYSYEKLHVTPPDDYKFMEEKKDRPPNQSQSINCPSNNSSNPRTNDPSCLVSGKTLGGKTVGYNLRGERGELSACFPFEPVVYVGASCEDSVLSGAKKTCKKAEEIFLAQQLIHHYKRFRNKCPIPQDEIPDLGVYPKKLNFVSVPRHLLVAQECNSGAFVTGYEKDGELNCECRFPFVPVPGQINGRGVICQDAEENCPNGTTLLRRKSDGSPVCKAYNSMTTRTFSPGRDSVMYAATRSASDSDRSLNKNGTSERLTNRSISCPNKGWLQDIDLRCAGEVTTEKHPGSGHSCLFFYEFAKYINFGSNRTLIDGGIPADFFPGDKVPCTAVSEKVVIKAPSNAYDALCVSTIFGLLMLGAAGTKALLKKTLTKVISKGTAKATGKGVTKAVSKEVAKKTGRAVSRSASKKAAEAASKEALDAGKAAALKAAREGLSASAIRKAAEEAAVKAAAKAAAKAIGESTAKRVGGDFAQKAGRDALEAAAREAGEQGGKAVLQKAAKKGAEKAAENAAKNLAKRSTRAKAIKEAGKTSLKKSVAAGGGLGGALVGGVVGDLTPPVFAAALALGGFIDAAAAGIAALRGIPFVGPAFALLAAIAAAPALASTQVKVNYDCYPINAEPSITCSMKGTCYHYEQAP